MNNHITQQFQLSPKLESSDFVKLSIAGKQVSQKVEDWIKNHPDILWHGIYDKGATIPLNLAALNRLERAIQSKFPELIKAREAKKLHVAIERKIRKQLKINPNLKPARVRDAAYKS